MNLSKKHFYLFLHAFFISGLLYAFYHFIRIPRHFELRRLWAYENWIIFSFYAIFVYLTLDEQETKKKVMSLQEKMSAFRRILRINIILLLFPWGLFLLLAPHDLLIRLELESVYWKILGAGSLIGAIVYLFSYRYYSSRLTRYIFIFGTLDNLISGIILTLLFLLGKVPLVAFLATPLLFYFAYFFLREAKDHD